MDGRNSAANLNGSCKFDKSPQPALALETNNVTSIPALRVMVIAREIVLMKFLFLPRVNPAYILKGAIRNEKLARSGKIFLAQLGQKPGSGQLPIAHDGVGGDFHHFGGLFHAQAPEESQFDDPGFAWIHFG